MKLAQRRPVIAVGLTLLVLLALIAAPASYVASKHQWALDKLAELEPRHARLKGLASVGEQLERGASEGDAALARVAYDASLDVSQAGNDAQQRARRALESAGMTISSSQILPAQPEGGFDRISISLRAEGNLPQLQAALAALAVSTPALTLELISMRGIGGATNESQRLACQFTLAVLRSRS